jgi:hypothetical protein
MKVCFFLLLLPFSLSAQQATEPVFTLKPSVGFNACQVHGDSFSGYHKFGAFGGVAVNAKLNQKLSLELGFYFSQKGARHNPDPDKGDITYYRLNLNYVDMPLSLRYAVNSTYFITLGPSVAYLISHNENINYIDRTADSKFNSTELGVNVGLGRKIRDRFSIEVRSSNSIKAIRSYGAVANLVFFPNPVARFFNKGFYNNILTLLLTYKLNFKKKSEPEQA